MTPILTNASATSSAVAWSGGKALFTINATWAGASASLQYLGPDGTTYVTIGSAFTANGTAVVEIPPGWVKVTITGGPPSAVYASLFPMSRA